MQFSYCMPSMWRYPPILKFLEDLVLFDRIDEILIWNNDEVRRQAVIQEHPTTVFDHPKVRLLGTGDNIGCNQAWNGLVREARNEAICMNNDDNMWPIQTLFRVEDHLSKEKPLICMSAGDPVWHQPPLETGVCKVVKWNPGESTFGAGCLFFIRKDFWVPIPESLKIFYGDNFFWDTCLIRRKPVHLLIDFMYKTPFAQTTKEIPNLNQLMLHEHRMYGEELRKWQTTL